MAQLRFKTRISLVLSLFFICLMAVLSVGTVALHTKLIRKFVATSQNQILTEIAASLDDKMMTARDLVARVADWATRSGTGPEKLASLEKRGELLAFFDAGIFLVSPEGKVLAALDPAPSGDPLPSGFTAIPGRLNRAQISEPFFSGATSARRLVVAVSAPVLDPGGRASALLVGRLNLERDSFLGRLKKIRLGETGYIALVNRSRTLIMHPDRDRILTRVPEGRNPLLERALQGYRGTEENTTSQGIKMISSFVPLSSIDWFLAANLPVAEAYAPVWRWDSYFLGAVAAATVISVGFVFAMMGRFTRPLRRLTGHVNELIEGDDLAPLKNFKLSTGDEIETLANAFSAMAAEIERRFTERKRAEEELRASEERYRTLFETTGTSTIIVDENATIRLMNHHAVQMFGYRKEEVEGKMTWIEFIHPDDRARTLEFSKQWRSQSDPQPATNEVRALTRSGAVVNLYGTVARIPGTTLSVSSHVDISELKRAQEALARERMLLQSLLDSIPDVIFYKDTQSITLGCNRAFEEFVGKREEEIVGKGPFDLFPQEVAEFYRLQDLLMLEQGTLRRNTECGAYPDGRLRLFEVIKAPMFDANGAIVGLIGVGRDITEQEQAASALRESEERFRQIFEQNEDAILLVRMDGVEIIDANSRADELFGWPHEELVGVGATALLAGEDAQALGCFLEEVRESGTGGGVRMSVLRRDGERRFVALRGKTISLGNEKVIYCSIRDITDKIRMEQEVREFQSKLISSNKLASLGLLVSGIAHEINNPNNLITVNSSLLSGIWRDTLPLLEEYLKLEGEFILGGMPFTRARQEVPRLIEGIHKGAKRIQNIVESLKGMVKDDSRNLMKKLDVNRVVNDALTIIGHEICLRTNAFALRLTDRLPPVQGNHQQIEQVVINLVVNALQSLPDKEREVVLATSFDPQTEEVLITVADQGEGIAPEHLARVTEPFFSTRLDRGGTGLGLSISLSIVKGHGGSLRFSSQPGAGTVVTVALPCYKSPAAEPAMRIRN